jgi:predicted kinase
VRLRPAGVAFLAGPGPSLELRYPADSLLLVTGMPGAGKTTLIGRLFPAAPSHVLDTEPIRARWRAHLRTRRGYAVYRPFVHLEHHLRVTRALAGRGPLVVHETGTRGWLRRALVRRAVAKGRPVHLLALDVTRPVAERGQGARGRRVRRGSMDRHERGFARLLRALRCAPAEVPLGPGGLSSCLVLDRAAAERVSRALFA